MITTRLIRPGAHMMFLEGETSPVFMDCTLDLCWICYKIEVGKLLMVLDTIVKIRKEQDDD